MHWVQGAPAGPALASGVVYRVKDDSIVVAVEEVPEGGLDQPLRLDKLANEVPAFIVPPHKTPVLALHVSACHVVCS